jgi:ABC-type multidrug transport system ATPase subunit
LHIFSRLSSVLPRIIVKRAGLAGVATKRVAGFSLGMGQRLGIAAALLGDPRTLLLDEPVNGLDPEGVQWVRQLVRALAAEGRTVFLSSHLMSEMSQTADHLLVIGRGRIIAAGPVQQVIDSVAGGAVRVRSPRAGELAAALAADGATVTSPEAGMLEVSGTTAERSARREPLVRGPLPQQPRAARDGTVRGRTCPGAMSPRSGRTWAGDGELPALSGADRVCRRLTCARA